MSSFPSARRARPAAAVLAVAIAVLSPAAGHAQSVGFTLRSSTGPTISSGTSGTRVRTRDAVMRFDGTADGRQQGELGEGTYTLVDAANRRIQIVMPANKQYMEIKFDDSTAMALKTAASVSTAVTDVRMSGQSLGSGGVVNGMPTSKYRLTTDFSEITMGGSGERPRKMHVVEEYWVADALRDVPDPMEQLGRTLGGKGGFAQSPYSAIGGTSLNEFMTRRMAEQRKLFKGFPVRTVTTSEETLASGEVQRSVSTTELSDVQRGNFDAALFKVPDGYTVFDPRAAMANMGAAFRDALKGGGRAKTDAAGAKAEDTTSLGDAAKEGAKNVAKEAGKDAAKDAVKGALGGFLRKKKP